MICLMLYDEMAGGWQLSQECTMVDAVVNTIGFPLVG